MKRWMLTNTSGEDPIYFDADDISSFPLPYAEQCSKLEAMAVGEKIPFGKGYATRLEDEASEQEVKTS